MLPTCFTSAAPGYNERQRERSTAVNLPDFLTEWPFGEIMIKGHRIGLYHVIRRYKDG